MKNKRMISQFLVLALCGAVLTGVEAHATTGEKPFRFPAQTVIEGQALQLHGTGVLRFKRIIPVYDAALYLGEGVQPGQALEDVPKRIEVRYRVSADADRFARAGDRILTKTFSETELAGIRSRLERMNGWYPDPKPGDRCSITYVPGKGTELAFNGRSLGWIEGADFARIYFAIWSGAEPASKPLREALLGPQGTDP